MPPYRHSDTVYLHNLIKIMKHHMHKQLFLYQCEMYIVVSHGKHVAELQMHWKDYLTDTWCYTRFPFEISSTTSILRAFSGIACDKVTIIEASFFLYL